MEEKKKNMLFVTILVGIITVSCCSVIQALSFRLAMPQVSSLNGIVLVILSTMSVVVGTVGLMTFKREKTLWIREGIAVATIMISVANGMVVNVFMSGLVPLSIIGNWVVIGCLFVFFITYGYFVQDNNIMEG